MTETPSPAVSPALLALRAQLDGLDDALHDLVMRRAEVVTEVGRLGGKGPVKLRPGREAAILRRLLARHQGALAPGRLVAMWREMINGMTAIQGPLVIAACAPNVGSGYIAAAREHFGAASPILPFPTPAQALGAVGAGAAAAAVLPVPADEDAATAAWWTALHGGDGPRLHVVARLPVWAPRPEGTRELPALLVTAASPDPSGDDRTLLGLEVAAETSRARLGRALGDAGFSAGSLVLRRDGAWTRALADVAGFVTADDPRLGRVTDILRPPAVLGAYAVPMGVQR